MSVQVRNATVRRKTNLINGDGKPHDVLKQEPVVVVSELVAWLRLLPVSRTPEQIAIELERSADE